MCPEKSFSWKMHFRQCRGSGDPYIIWSQVSVDLHMLASHNRKKSNYQRNNLQVRGPPVCTQMACKSSKLDPGESDLALNRDTSQLREQASFLTQVSRGAPVCFRGTGVYRPQKMERTSAWASGCLGLLHSPPGHQCDINLLHDILPQFPGPKPLANMC